MDTRKDDLLDLMAERRNAKNAFERDMADRVIGRIRSESRRVEDIRKKLVMSIRNDDRHAQKRFERELMVLRGGR